MKKRTKKRKWLIFLIVWLILIVTIKIFFVPQITQRQSNAEDVEIVSILEKIINVSELSTFSAVYNGVAQVMNEKNPDQVDYYVSYEATVKAGIEFDQIDINPDTENMIIYINMPDVKITDVNVDITSLDFIFLNEKANNETVSQEAYKACEMDAQQEAQQQEAIFELATENAQNMLMALTSPIIERLYPEYTLIIK